MLLNWSLLIFQCCREEDALGFSPAMEYYFQGFGISQDTSSNLEIWFCNTERNTIILSLSLLEGGERSACLLLFLLQ